MKRIDLDRRRGLPYAVSFAYYADGQQVMFTGDGLTNLDHIKMHPVPAIVKTTRFEYFAPLALHRKRTDFKLIVPDSTYGCGENVSVRLLQLSGGQIRKEQKSRVFNIKYRVHDINDLNKLNHRQMFAVTREQRGDSDRTIYLDILCTFRSIPNKFPDKLVDVLQRHDLWSK